MQVMERHYKVGRGVTQFDQLPLELHQAGQVFSLLSEDSLVGLFSCHLYLLECVDGILEHMPAVLGDAGDSGRWVELYQVPDALNKVSFLSF